MPEEDCVDDSRTEKLTLRLNASALSDPTSLVLDLFSELSPKTIKTLVDSGSSHCFLDSDFADSVSLESHSVPPIRLQLFDGTSNQVITRVATVPLHFPAGEVLSVDFYLPPLDKSVSAVLGYRWLSDYNLLIDWKMHSKHFRTTPTLRPSDQPSILSASVAPTRTEVRPPTHYSACCLSYRRSCSRSRL